MSADAEEVAVGAKSQARHLLHAAAGVAGETGNVEGMTVRLWSGCEP